MSKTLVCFLSLFVVALVCLLPGIQNNALLLQGDEVMHIATVRESLSENTLLLPNLDGSANYYKPPLLFWLGMLSEKLLGASFFANRLPIALLVSLSVPVFWLILLELQVSFHVSLVFASVYLLNLATFKFSRLLMMEGGFLSSIVFFLYFYILYHTQKKLVFLFLAGLVAGASYFYKGPLFLIYTTIFLFTYYGTYILRFRNKPFFWKGKKYVRAKLQEFFLFSLSSLLPLVVWFIVIFFNKRIDLLAYFLVIENIGKFFEVNQSEFQIVWGWVLYTIPSGVFLFFVALKGFFQRSKTLNHILGKVLITTSYFFTLFHLLPNRKDPYYVLPAIPLLVIGVALLFHRETFSKYRSILRWNFIFNFCIFLLLSIAVFLGSEILAYKVLLFVCLVLLFVSLFLFLKNSVIENYIQYTMLFQYAIFMLGLQFLVLPALYLPLFPQEALSEVKGTVCLVSSEPWDGYDLKNHLTNTKVVHSLTINQPICEKEDYLFVHHTEKFEAPSNYLKVKEWKVWSKNIKASDMKDILNNKDFLYKKSYLAKKVNP